MLSTGDDEGVIKLWDTRTPNAEAIRAYTHHFDFISDFLWLEDKKHLVATSGDGTVSVIDVRSSKTVPYAQSENQEDELLSIAPIKGNTKAVVGTQTGILSVFNRSSGWGDCVDRIPGHPYSIDALVPLTSDVIATGSSDGLIRVVQILPSKLLGVIADHGSFPVERLKTDRHGKWLGSASHDDILKMTDISDALEDSDGEDEGEGEGEAHKADSNLLNGSEPQNKEDEDSDQSEDSDAERPGLAVSAKSTVPPPKTTVSAPVAPAAAAAAAPESDSDASIPPEKKRKRKKKGGNQPGGKKGKTGGDDSPFSFFSGLE